MKIKTIPIRLLSVLLALVLFAAPVLALPDSGEERLDLLKEILEFIDTYALERPAELSLRGVTAFDLEKDDSLFSEIVAAWLAGDTYGHFMTREEYVEAFDIGGETLYGIGIQVDTSMPLGVYVTSFLPGGGAERSGMEIGAQIVYVDGVNIADAVYMEIRSLILGEWYASVEIGYINPGSAEVIFERIQRGALNTDYVQCQMIDGADVGYISIERFGSTWDISDFYYYYNEYLPFMGANSVIIDLRGNPGGQLGTVLDMLNVMMVEEGNLLCRELFADGQEEYFSFGREEFELWDIYIWEPETVVILVDGGSASASEIFSGTLQAYGLAVVVGETTYGKAHSQYHHALSSGDVLILTVAGIELHEIGSYEDTGILPDHEAAPLLLTGADLVYLPLDTSRALFRQSALTGRITAMQERLALLGFYRCEPSGVFDDYTLWCLNRFQVAYDIPQGRFANIETLKALNEAAMTAEFYYDMPFDFALGLCLEH